VRSSAAMASAIPMVLSCLLAAATRTVMVNLLSDVARAST
jgi:hypothetical protein